MKVNFMKLLTLSVILIGLAFLVPEAKANLLGHIIQFNASYAGSTYISSVLTVINPGIEISCPSPTAVGPGCGGNINGGGYTIDFQDNAIIFNTSALFSSTYGADRNYLTFTILDPGYIFTNAVLSSTNIPGLTAGRVTFTTKTAKLDVSGLPAPAIQSTVIAVQVGTGNAGPQINPVTNPINTNLAVADSEINDLALGISNLGILNILGGGLLENLLGSIDSSGTINNSGILSNLGLITNELGASIGNLGSILNSGTLQNNGTTTNQAAGMLENLGLTTNLLNGLLDNLGNVLNGGLVQNLGSMVNELNATMQNNGSIVNELNASMTNLSSMVNDVGGIYRNFGQILQGVVGEFRDVSANLDNRGILDNDGNINNNGTITNSGTVNVNANGSITGIGDYIQNAGVTTIMGALTQGNVEIQGGLMQIQDAGQVIINSLP